VKAEAGGKAMTRKGLAGFLFAALACVPCAPPAFAACEKLQQLASVEVEINDNGAVMLPVKVNGQDAWMILGMASGVPTAWRESALQLGLKLRNQSDVEMTVRGTKVTQKTVVDSLVIGTANFTKWDLYVMPGGSGTAPTFRDRPVLGGLTSRFIGAVDLELNLAAKRVNLFKQTDRCKGRQVYWGGEVTEVDLYYDPTGLLVFPMEIDGKRVEASLNTQGRSSLISETVTKRFFGFDRESPGITRESNDAGNDRASYRAMGLTAKGLAMKNVRIQLYDDLESNCLPSTSERNTRAIGFNGCWSRAPLSIGTDLLSKLRIYIASKEAKVYFTRAAEPVPATGSDPSAAAGLGAPAAAGAAANSPGAAAPAAGAAAAAPAGDAPPAR
jgi:hypothetical protein